MSLSHLAESIMAETISYKEPIAGASPDGGHCVSHFVFATGIPMLERISRSGSLIRLQQMNRLPFSDSETETRFGFC